MGTKIQANAFFREYHSVIDLDGSTSNGMRSLYNQNQIVNNGYLPGYDPEKVRQTILEHESIFRNQLQELHRLYGRQRELMNEIKRREINKDSRSLRNCDMGNRNNQSYDRATLLSLSSVQTTQNNAHALKFNLNLKRSNHPGELSAKNSSSNLNLVTQDFFRSSNIDVMNGRSSASILGLRNDRSGNELISDDYAGKRKFDRHSQSLKGFLNSPKDLDTSVSQRKRKLFGVELSEPKMGVHQGNQCVVSFQTSSWIDNSFMQNLGGTNVNDCKNEGAKADLIGPNFVRTPCTESDQRKYFKNSNGLNSRIAQHHILPLPSDCEKSQENPKGGLPWFLRTSQVSNDVNKERRDFYFMNLDSLQNCSDKFFQKSETDDVTFPTLQQKNNEISGSGKLETGEDSPKNIPKTKEISYMSEMRHQIDLNLSLDEEGAPSFPSSVVKIATTEIDLEAPAVIESETDTSHEDKTAAEAIILISQFKGNTPVDTGACDRLKWFAEIVSSNILLEESIPDEMDHFEYMTLKLEDTKVVEVHNYKPIKVLTNSPSDDENVRAKRCRRGRQRNKDFKRDILPGLVTLSRMEVTEDLQAFDELMKAKDGNNNNNNNLKLCMSQRSSIRKSRGRRRTLGSTTSPRTKELCPGPQKQPVCQLVEKSLMGWGKRTRRLPRQRCHNAFLSFAVKC